eukprot:7762301-Pyramimonas_sp.AAC.1
MQMCNKQCRDENGFKCHTMSESHQQQMLVFGAAPVRVIEGYSEMFLETFMNHMKMRYAWPFVLSQNILLTFTDEIDRYADTKLGKTCSGCQLGCQLAFA